MTHLRKLARWLDDYTTWALNPGSPLDGRNRPRS